MHFRAEYEDGIFLLDWVMICHCKNTDRQTNTYRRINGKLYIFKTYLCGTFLLIMIFWTYSWNIEQELQDTLYFASRSYQWNRTTLSSSVKNVQEDWTPLVPPSLTSNASVTRYLDKPSVSWLSITGRISWRLITAGIDAGVQSPSSISWLGSWGGRGWSVSAHLAGM